MNLMELWKSSPLLWQIWVTWVTEKKRRPSVVVPMLPDRDVEELWNETFHFNSTSTNGDHQEASRKLIKAILIYGSFSVLYMITAIKIFIKVR